jgi:hypothetical protein
MELAEGYPALPGNFSMSQITTWCLQRRARIAWLLIGLAITGWGIYNWDIGRSTETCLALNVAQLEAGEPLPGRWLELTGIRLNDDRTIWPEHGLAYYPVVSETWKPGTPIAAFARASPEDFGAGRLNRHKGPSVTGIVDPDGLPGPVRDRFESLERPAADRAIVLDFEKTPGQELVRGYVAMVIGLTIVAITGLVWLFYREPVAQVESPESGKVVTP